MQLDSNGNLYQGSGNPIYSNVKFQQRYSGSGSDYYWFADDPFNTTVHYMRGDGAAYHAAGIALGGSKFTVDANGNITKINNVTTSFPGSQGSANTVLTNNGSGTLTWGNIATEGTYTPTLTNTTNVTSSTAFTSYYVRVGDYVYVWGEVEIDATTSLTLTELGMSLPIASSITDSRELAGTAAHEDNTAIQIKGDASNNRAMFRFTPQSGSINMYSFHFSYKYVAP